MAAHQPDHTDENPEVIIRYDLHNGQRTGIDILPTAALMPFRSARRRQKGRAREDLLSRVCAATATGTRLPGCTAIPYENSDQTEDEFLSRLRQTLLDTGTAAASVEIEFPESTLLNITENMIYTLSGLRDAGAGVVMTGLGHTQTSLTLLRDLAFMGLISTIKLDRHLFVTDPGDIHSDHPLAAALLRIAHDLGLKTRAEGIDSRQTLAFLTEHKCQEGCGQALSPALPLSGLTNRRPSTRRNPR
ncbi:EAL domain-containing protein [Acetobacter sp. AN02]|uniref:EAL domain-containing protein n=1 Tax=Acetobacter sp. AN02 TaxID=2894186 RepID=UPI0024341848|nr:EAL domain-containing protein [Acetobacter sp. AN02]MDG6093876.1 EAL domain-containing protein [Acetobacter sp. AN02]